MKYIRLALLLMLVSFCSLHVLSPTLAQFSSEYSGSDTAVVAKWNFRVGAEDSNLGVSDLNDFDLFKGEILGPTSTSQGAKSFFISAEGSDVDIEYEVFMHADDFSFEQEENKYYLPLVFRVNEGTNFTLEGEEGYFSVATGDLKAEQTEEVIIAWWWDASYYNNKYSMTNEAYGNEVLKIIDAMEPPFAGNIKFKVEGRQIKPEKI